MDYTRTHWVDDAEPDINAANLNNIEEGLVAAQAAIQAIIDGGGGVVSHGELDGLDEDDHPQYLTTGRGDSRYVRPSDLPSLDGYVTTDDSRLSDARPPTEHRHPWADLDDVPEIPSEPADIGAQPAGDYLTASDLPEPPDLSDVVREDDPRLSDAREPTEHSHPEYLTADDVPEFPDLSAFVETDDPRLSDARTPLDHRHDWSDLDDVPAIPASPEDIGAQPAGDYAAGDHDHDGAYVKPDDLPDPPDLSGYVQDDDPRLSDARPPTEHDHDDRYYTESEVDTALGGKADTSHSHPVSDLTATGTPSETTYLRGDGAWATPEGGGSQGPSHESILATGNVTLPTEHPVLTIRADDPATLSLLEAPDGTVVTIHVAHGWENLTWGPGITVTGDSATTETWVVLVRAEGEWQALVSGESGGGGGVQDTGARDVSDMVQDINFHPTWGEVTLQRWGSLVTVSVSVFTKEWEPGGTDRLIFAIPAGFRPPPGSVSGALSGGNGDWTLDAASSGNVMMTAPSGTPLPTNAMQFAGSMTYLTPDPWPETLPGVPA